MTFSIAARCPLSGQFGIAISSSSPAVAARCAHVRARVGAVASQNVTDPRLGTQGLDLMAGGLDAMAALARLKAGAGPGIEYRQLLLIDSRGGVATFSGRHTLGTHAVATGDGVAAAGNLLAGTAVPQAMLDRFAATAGRTLGDRLVAAMRGGVAAGGEAGPVRSAGMLIADREAWPMTDLRVDWLEESCPIERLAALWELWKPQAAAYVTRALDPTAAPSYGVPGDE